MCRLFASFLLALLCASSAEAQSSFPENYDELLSLDANGVRSFLSKHPDKDGRGVVIAVLDTGVDPTQPGLTKTSHGKIKVLGARDFSGEGDVSLQEVSLEEKNDAYIVDIHGENISLPKKLVPKILNRRVWLASVAESRFSGTSIPDVNGNGRGDDTYRFVVIRDQDLPGSKGWRILVDRDGDNQIDDAGLRPYEIDQELLFLGPEKLGEGKGRLGISVHVRTQGPTLELHAPSGSHGTHVAGIAAGFGMMGRTGFNGVAPGSQILSLKIGNTGLSGGASTTAAKKKALHYAARWSEIHDIPVVANISYGIGSETEGSHEIEALVDDLLRKTPRLSVVISGGNSGPGISTIGTPAGALLATTVAAGFTQAQTGPLLGKKRSTGTEPLFFSSRGGELAKPDIMTPGIALASVPDYDAYPIKAGTSMAAPIASGLSALLWDEVTRHKETGHLHHGDIKKALIEASSLNRDFLFIEQGHGLPEINRAILNIQKRIRDGGEMPLALSVNIESRRLPDVSFPGFFWRLPVAPAADDLQQMEIQAILPEWWSTKKRKEYFSRVRLEGIPKWVQPNRKTGALKGDAPISFPFRIQEKMLRSYGGITEAVGSVVADDGMSAAIPLVWVIPNQRDAGTLMDLEIKPGEVQRRFVEIPEGISHLHFKASAKGKDAIGTSFILLYDPEGRPIEPYQHKTKLPERPKHDFFVAQERLIPGIWEVLLYGHHRNPTSMKVHVETFFTKSTPTLVDDISRQDEGPLEVAFTLRSMEKKPVWLKTKGSIHGIHRREELMGTGDKLNTTFNVAAPNKAVEISISLPGSTWQRVTDVAVRIFPEKGTKPIFSTSLNHRKYRLRFRPPSAGVYRCELWMGLTDSSEETIYADLDIRIPLEKPLKLEESGDALDIPLYPGISRELYFESTGVPPSPGATSVLYGHIDFMEKSSGRLWHRVELKLLPD